MSITRRDFLRTSLIGGAVGAVGTGAAATSIVGCGNNVAPPLLVNGSVDDDATSATYGQVIIDLAEVPSLMTAGAAATIRLAPLSASLTTRPFRLPSPPDILLIHRMDTTSSPDLAGVAPSKIGMSWIAFNSACPHAGCPLGYNPTSGYVECPCHSSKFLAFNDGTVEGGTAGQVIHPPAQQGLQGYVALYLPERHAVSINLRASLGCTDLPSQGTVLQVDTSTNPGNVLKKVGGFFIGGAEGCADPLLIARIADTGAATDFIAVSAVCTHRGCLVEYDATRNDIKCPCHGSRYSNEGAVTQCPAGSNSCATQGPLKRYAVQSFDGKLVQIETAAKAT